MAFEKENWASSSLPLSPSSPSSVVSLAQRLARIRSELDALAEVSSRELDGAGALALFDGVFELSDRMQAIAVRVLPVGRSRSAWSRPRSSPPPQRPARYAAQR